MGVLRVATVAFIAFSLWAGTRMRAAQAPQGEPVGAAGTRVPDPGARVSLAPQDERQPVTGTVLSASLVTSVPAAANRAIAEASVTRKAVVLRAKPTKNSAAHGSLKAGTQVTMLEQRGRWVRVRPPSPSQEGWVSMNHLVVARAKPSLALGSDRSLHRPASP